MASGRDEIRADRLVKIRTYQRSKRSFRTARAAWSDIKKRMRKRYRSLKPEHTRTHWRWRVV